MTSFVNAIQSMSLETYNSLRKSLEIGKWPNGKTLEQEQKEIVLQALIAWGTKNLPEEQRIGYLAKKNCGSQSSKKIPVV